MAWERARNAGQSVTLDESEELVMPAVVWAEALAGVRLADSAARAARRMAWLEALRRVMGVEPFTAETAEHHADIFAELTLN
ncbi:MAG: PIN domain-containing protein, partial [Luteolibacter sp.]